MSDKDNFNKLVFATPGSGGSFLVDAKATGNHTLFFGTTGRGKSVLLEQEAERRGISYDELLRQTEPTSEKETSRKMEAKVDAIHVNVWDDYHDDGFVPEGEIQETYAYVEGDLSDDDSRAVLLQFQNTVELIKFHDSALTCCIKWHDSAAIYPNLVGTEHERHLYKRWQLQLTNLTHREREQIVEALGHSQFQYNGRPVVVYSES